MDITEITVVPEDKDPLKDYQWGDIGQPLNEVGDSRWMLCCPGCGAMTVIMPKDRVIKHDDGTVSSTQPLHCHGSKAMRRFVIEHNKVRWLDHG
jgi:hypothetical protein